MKLFLNHFFGLLSLPPLAFFFICGAAYMSRFWNGWGAWIPFAVLVVIVTGVITAISAEMEASKNKDKYK